MFKTVIRVQLLILLALAACNPEGQNAGVGPEENTQCPYKLPFSSTLGPVRVSQSISDPTNASHQPDTFEEFAIDLSLKEGTPVLTARDGTLSAFHDGETLHGSSPSFAKYANFVIIDHGDGTFALYYHLQRTVFSSGDIGTRQVQQGELVGYSGNTGWSTNPHLHFQVQTSGDKLGQSVPFCFSDVEGEVPRLNQYVTSQNKTAGAVEGAQVESYTENLSAMATNFSGEVSYFTIDEASNEAYFVVQKLATGERKVTALVKGEPFHPLITAYTWSPDGKTLVTSWAYAIYSKNYDTGEVKLNFQPEGEETLVPDFWAPVMDWFTPPADKNGGLIIDCLWVDHDYSPPRTWTGICWYSFSIGKLIAFYADNADYPLSPENVEYSYPSWADQTLKVAFLRQYFRDGEVSGNAELIVYNLKDDGVVKLNIQGIQPIFLKFTHDGKQVIFLGYEDNDPEKAAIWVIEVQGSHLTKLIDLAGSTVVGMIDLSDDEEKIIYSKDSDLWILDLATGMEVQITNTPDILETQPAFRPNH